MGRGTCLVEERMEDSDCGVSPNPGLAWEVAGIALPGIASQAWSPPMPCHAMRCDAIKPSPSLSHPFGQREKNTAAAVVPVAAEHINSSVLLRRLPSFGVHIHII